jgi:predicted amidohydrolase YtcJ
MGTEKHRYSECCGSLLEVMLENAGLKLSRRDFIKGATATTVLMTTGRAAWAASSGDKSASGDTSADTIYHGGSIVTMVTDQDQVEALAVKNGRILCAGSKSDVLACAGETTKTLDLKGRCLMPGFIDPHSHVVLQSAKFATVNLDPRPIGEVSSIADIQRLLREHIKKNNLAPGKWVIGWGYDDTGIEEMRHPMREDLDAVSTEHPILLVHISCHLCTGNSFLMQEIGVSEDTPDPEGGKIQRKPGSREPSGVLEELAMLHVVKKLPAPTPEKAMEMIEQGLKYYAAAGITTAQDGATGPGAVNLLEAMDVQGRLPIDVIVYPIYKSVDNAMLDVIAADKGVTRRLRRGGVKLTIDGSIQGYTAFLSKPYHVQPGETAPRNDKCFSENAEHIFVSDDTPCADAEEMTGAKQGHRGYANMQQEEVIEWIRRCDRKEIQILSHTNGDAASDMLIEAVETVRGGKPRPDLRTTIIHAQTMREDQLDASAKHGLVPSFFPIHITFWGDRHRDIFLGPQRARRISPAKSALDRGIKFTLHHDAPVAGIGMLQVASASVNRITSGGKELGPEQRITAFEALRAITADAAWQYFEEDSKGTLENGKLADLVILSDNPMTVDPMKMVDIEVLETIKEGVTIYQVKA